MRYLIALLFICTYAHATEITLTQSQVDAVLADNPQSCPPVDCPDPIDPPPEPPVDPTPPPEPSQCVDSTDPSTIQVWESVLYGEFPMPTYQNVTYKKVPQDGYYALAFNTEDVLDSAKFSLLENPATPGMRLAAYSECRGDFDVAPECQKQFGLGGGITWSTEGKAGACQLKPNTTYFFNVTFKVDGVTSNCAKEPCYISYQYSNQ